MADPEIQRELINGIRNHPFEYGFSAALDQSGSKIQKVGGEYTLFFTPPGVNDKQWFGDCAADALLTVKALHGIQADTDGRVEDYTFGFHGAGFTATHYRVYAGGDRIPMDHSEFYANLNMEYAEQDVTEIDPALELIGDIGVGDGSRNFAEFRDGDNLYLTTFTVREMAERPDDVLISSSVFEQDQEGIVRRQIQVSNFVPKLLNQQFDERQVRNMFQLTKAHVTQHGKGEWQDFGDGIVKDQITRCMTSVVNAFARGNT